jgi:hypothetical protein
MATVRIIAIRLHGVNSGPDRYSHGDGTVVETLKPGKQVHRGAWTDPQPMAGLHYYYARIEQEDGELAWASPLWIDYRLQ